MARRSLLTLAVSFALAATAAAGAADHSHHVAPKAPTACAETSLKCAAAATPAVAPDGGLWLAWSAGGRVWVARSADQGASFADAVNVSGAAATIDDGGEARPKVFADAQGRILVTWTVRQDKAYTGTVWLARSTDGGRTFEPPRKLSDDPVSQRFETLVPTADGKLAALWIDKRGLAAAKKAGHAYAGAALVGAWSEDGGATFGPSRVLADNSCECCRLGVAQAPEGSVAVTWRQVFDGTVRDHAAATFGPEGLGPLRRVAVDDWQVDACPHHGPALAVDGAGTWHIAWFTDGRARQGLFHARSTDGGRTFSAPRPLGDPDRAPGHAQLLALGERVWLAWKEFDGERATVVAQSSADRGATWTSPRVVAATAGGSDHPLLLAVGGQPRLSWLTQAEGWRLLPVEAAP